MASGKGDDEDRRGISGNSELDGFDLRNLPPSPPPVVPDNETGPGIRRPGRDEPRSPDDVTYNVTGNSNANMRDMTISASSYEGSGSLTIAERQAGVSGQLRAEVRLNDSATLVGNGRVGPGSDGELSVAIKDGSNQIGAGVVTNGNGTSATFNAGLGDANESGAVSARLGDETTATFTGNMRRGNSSGIGTVTIGQNPSANVSLTETRGSESFTFGVTGSNQTRVEGAYTRDQLLGPGDKLQVSGNVAANGEFAATVNYSATLPLGTSNSGSRSRPDTDFGRAADDLRERLDNLVPPRGGEQRPSADLSSLSAPRPNPELVAQATRGVESVNRALPPGAVPLPVEQTAESLAVLAEKRGLSGIGFVELGGQTSNGRNLFIGQEANSREQAAANGVRIHISGDEAARGPTSDQLASLNEIRSNPIPSNNNVQQEEQRTLGGRSIG